MIALSYIARGVDDRRMSLDRLAPRRPIRTRIDRQELSIPCNSRQCRDIYVTLCGAGAR